MCGYMNCTGHPRATDRPLARQATLLMEQLAGHMALAAADLLLWQHAPVTVRSIKICSSTTLISHTLSFAQLCALTHLHRLTNTDIHPAGQVVCVD